MGKIVLLFLFRVAHNFCGILRSDTQNRFQNIFSFQVNGAYLTDLFYVNDNIKKKHFSITISESKCEYNIIFILKCVPTTDVNGFFLKFLISLL